ncbi:sterol desaturase family protein [Nocardia sp. NBC_01329]|uniref:sterol desaturase family protein n=1 Tax=Nocardia sp. NBC_01329 TaxID=2903594 RepID=UPI002E155AE3|nr:sterol desaturase family protein [Nocardia sp. NBC_01329]
MHDLLFAVPTLIAFVLLMLAEWIASRIDPDTRPGLHGYDGKEVATNIATFVLSRVTKPILTAISVVGPLALAAALAPFHLDTGTWWVWPLAFVVVDFFYYWAHRADHRVRLMWTSHSVHHSSQYFNLSTAIRLPWLNPSMLVRGMFFAPAALLGIPVWMVLLMQSLNLLFQFPIHTERVGRVWGPIEYLFNTPSHHRVHHGSNNPYLDRNYGGVFIVWDRLFGSYADEVEPARYGLVHNIDTRNPIRVNYAEFAAMLCDIANAKTWAGRFGYLLAPPGYREKAPAGSPSRRAGGPHIGISLPVAAPVVAGIPQPPTGPFPPTPTADSSTEPALEPLLR